MADISLGFLVIYFANRAGFWRCAQQTWRGTNIVSLDGHRSRVCGVVLLFDADPCRIGARCRQGERADLVSNSIVNAVAWQFGAGAH